MAKKEEQKEEKKIFMYVGPHIKGGFLQKYQSVGEEFREVLKDEIEKVPNLEKLFIEISEVNQKMNEINAPESIYKKFIEEVKNVGI